MTLPVNLNIGCGPFYIDGWHNVDVVENEAIKPDQVVKYLELPFDDSSFEKIYMGHVLEHVRWESCEEYLRNVLRVLKPGGTLMVVGPDVRDIIEQYKAGREKAEEMFHAMEDFVEYQNVGLDWEGARHQWNCYPERVKWILEKAGFASVKVHPFRPGHLRGWPVVSFRPSQLAVSGIRPV